MQERILILPEMSMHHVLRNGMDRPGVPSLHNGLAPGF